MASGLLLDALVAHVTLPPRLPFRDDNGGGTVDTALARRLAKHARSFRDNGDMEYYNQWCIICRALDNFVNLNGHLSKDVIKDALLEISKSQRDFLMIHVATQNAGLIVRRVTQQEYIFEAFEASAKATDVLSSVHAMQWDFPSHAVAISSDTFDDSGFQEHIAGFLERASIESVKEFAATTTKAGSDAFESRDTASPVLIGHLLMAFLETNGYAQATPVTRKRVRDDVCWGDGARNPWRRSAAWLVLRVGIQRSLCVLLGCTIGTLHYKFFVASFIASLCDEMCEVQPIKAEYLAHVRSKLARRLAKLQTHIVDTSSALVGTVEKMFTFFGTGFVLTLKKANNKLAAEWVEIRHRSQKRVPRLPSWAEERSLSLSLHHSGEHLHQLCQPTLLDRMPLQRGFVSYASYLPNYAKTATGPTQTGFEVCHYLELFDFESHVELRSSGVWHNPSQSAVHDQCSQLADKIHQYQRSALSAYNSDPEQLSLMILTIMELWTALDLILLQLYPLLAEYGSGLPTNVLQVLQIPRLSDLRRLQVVENHLLHRHKSANPSLPSIFSDPSEKCFAVRYFDRCPSMQELLKRITSDGDKSRELKESEWIERSAEFEGLLKKAAESTCLYYERIDEFGITRSIHSWRNCQKCQLERTAKAVRIAVHEYPLPDDQSSAKATVFELLCPGEFAAWRDTTWTIINKLGRKPQAEDREPQLLLCEYSELQSYGTRDHHVISLASKTKSFLKTHYSQLGFPVPLEKVCLPNGLRFGLYDQQQKLWTWRQTARPSFADLCTSSLPAKSSFSSLGPILRAVSENTVPSANEVIAGQTDCPITLTVFEYQGFQELALGLNFRWIQILRELASPSLNFGAPATVTLVSQLALQAGRPWEDNALRFGHWVFQDDQFCAQFIVQIRKRLTAISTNWRESQTLECMITLVQRLWQLGESSKVIEQAAVLLMEIRATTLGWTRLLRREIFNAGDGKFAQARSRDAFSAALLCRRTFVLEAYNTSDRLDAEELACFIEASIVMNDNMPESGPGRISRLPLHLRNMFLRDLRVVHHLQSKLRLSILATGIAVDQAMNSIWPEPEDAPARSFTAWEFLPAPHEHCILAKSIGTDNLRSQEVSYNIIEGSLFVDGQPLSRLPEEYTTRGFFQQYLGERLCLTYPSSAPGMGYTLAGQIYGHQVHFGFRDGVPIMRAFFGRSTLELIPPEIFCGPSSTEIADLPMSLIEKHVHWLDLGLGVLHIRPRASMWQSDIADWKLNIWTHQAERRGSLLVDVHSVVFQRIASIIEPFEHRNQMIVFQPEKSALSVTLPTLEIHFWVNSEGLLQSQQLQSVIDDDQDAGTLYGLESKLVLRDPRNPRERSILIAMGPAKIQRYMGHVRIRIEHTGFYCRLHINNLLNRLECPAEPRVVYMKAYCHAITAYVQADPLTGRTGTEEALHCLSLGNAQPWTPVDQEAYRLLLGIASLTPKRFYYPHDMKVQQKVTWTDYLAFSSQDDEFLPAVTRILRQCSQLHRFNAGPEPPFEDPSGDVHLLERARRRYQVHRPGGRLDVRDVREQVPDTMYSARDSVCSIRRTNAFEAATLTKRWSSQIEVTKDLASVMEGWTIIQGYQDEDPFESYLLDQLIYLDIGSRWGSVFRHCQALSRSKDLHRAMLFFATIAFGRKVDMIIVKTLIAFTVMEEFQSLVGPKWDRFTHFRRGQTPSLDYLVRIMSPAIAPYPEDERSLLGEISLNNKQRRKLESKQAKYEKMAKQDCEATASYLLLQWPCESPSLAHYDSSQHIDLERATLLVRSEWQFMFKNYELWVHLQDIQRLLDLCGPIVETPLSGMEGLDRDIYPKMVIPDGNTTLQGVMKAAAELHYKSHPITSSLISANSHEMLASPELDIVTTPEPCGAQSTLSVPDQQRPFSIGPIAFKPTKRHLSEMQELQSIIDPFVRHDDPVRKAYGEYLQSSLDALKGFERNEASDPSSIDRTTLSLTLSSCRDAVQSQFNLICMKLNGNRFYPWLSRGGLWPTLTPITLLETLGSSSTAKSSGRLRQAIIIYGELITTWQRLLRIEAALQRSDTVQLLTELENTGHGEWLPKDHPDWLLLEIENNILIRTDQCRVAKAMIAPQSGSNSVLQMNMGQGKSSIIIPMIATMLANKKQLFRVIVPKPLLLQMAQLLQARLGGLLGRIVKHVQFSRKSSTSKDNIKAYWDIHRETLKAQGIILALPEHLLSFKLSGLQKLSSGRVEEAVFMMQVQNWLLSRFRDVLDECDHSLAVKTQLVYPSGAQSMIDGHPNRWKVVQGVLHLSRSLILQLQRDFPRSVEVTGRAAAGGFPAAHFSESFVKDVLLQRLTEAVYRGEGGILPVNDCTKSELEAVVSFLKIAYFPKDKTSKILDIFKDRPAARRDLLLLRGLLVHRILLMALSKRWNVQYGLHPMRDPVAVPFTAKGKPSEQAEFGHPDVAILLTCLSFYFAGLAVSQFQKVLKYVLKSDDPALEYDRWVRSADSVPDSLRSWAAINVDDELQCQELWRHLQYNIIVIDCFLNNFVFPYHAKTFQRKLVSSAWDIPLQPPFRSTQRQPTGQEASEVDQRPITTGFSGTNDNRTLLPLNIEQRDLPGLTHTNAEVLTYLLQRRNRRYVLAADYRGRRLTEYDFLKLIRRHRIKMLLDAGAQILELDNFSLAKAWLDVDSDAEAAVFFDVDDKARVLYKDGRSMPLVASPYNDNLGACVVYLDEAHTRGTDLKMPGNSVAALTLGPGQTKDHTVQGTSNLLRFSQAHTSIFHLFSQ